MMEDKEIKAIADVLASFADLDSQARERVLKYVIERLGITVTVGPSSAAGVPVPPGPVDRTISAESTVFSGSVKDIRSLKEQKQPKSAIQMAALVAYYLQEVAVGEEKKDSVGVTDIQTYFKQAGFALPKIPKMALINAKTAGYLESADRGNYRLNPVGYNLVVHGLPTKGGSNNGKKGKKKAKNIKRKK